jgi:hypothetical protein
MRLSPPKFTYLRLESTKRYVRPSDTSFLFHAAHPRRYRLSTSASFVLGPNSRTRSWILTDDKVAFEKWRWLRRLPSRSIGPTHRRQRLRVILLASSQIKTFEVQLTIETHALHCHPRSRHPDFGRTSMTLRDTLAPYVAGTIAGLLVLSALKRRAASRSLPLPPGPKPLPLIGNLLDIPTSMEWLTYQAWNERYGDVVYVEALGKKIIILGSATAVNDLMERRSSVYSDRPNFVMQNELYVIYRSDPHPSLI